MSGSGWNYVFIALFNWGLYKEMMIGLGQHVAAGNLRSSANLVVRISCVKGERERE